MAQRNENGDHLYIDTSISAVKSLKGLNKYYLTASQLKLEFQKEERIVDKSYASIKKTFIRKYLQFSNNFTMSPIIQVFKVSYFFLHFIIKSLLQ